MSLANTSAINVAGSRVNDALSLLAEDHARVNGLFERVQAATEPAVRGELVQEILRELESHARLEEGMLYPLVAASVPGAQAMVDGNLDEHRQFKELMADIGRLEPSSPTFDDTLGQLMEQVRHHVSEEEDELFPQIRGGVSAQDLNAIGMALVNARETPPGR